MAKNYQDMSLSEAWEYEATRDSELRSGALPRPMSKSRTVAWDTYLLEEQVREISVSLTHLERGFAALYARVGNLENSYVLGSPSLGRVGTK